jgi:hypothetical protein
MRTDPDKYSSLIYCNNPESLSSSSRDNSNISYMSSGRQQQPQYDYYSNEDWNAGLLDQAEKFYTSYSIDLYVKLLMKASLIHRR